MLIVEPAWCVSNNLSFLFFRSHSDVDDRSSRAYMLVSQVSLCLSPVLCASVLDCSALSPLFGKNIVPPVGGIDWIRQQVCALAQSPPTYCGIYANETGAPTGTDTVPVVLEVQHDEFPEETEWTLSDKDGHVIDSQRQSDLIPKHELVVKTYHLSPGSYGFVITDSFEDGIW